VRVNSRSERLIRKALRRSRDSEPVKFPYRLPHPARCPSDAGLPWMREQSIPPSVTLRERTASVSMFKWFLSAPLGPGIRTTHLRHCEGDVSPRSLLQSACQIPDLDRTGGAHVCRHFVHATDSTPRVSGWHMESVIRREASGRSAPEQLLVQCALALRCDSAARTV
jgi:hypothetical protein